MKGNIENKANLITKWLGVLFCIHIVSIINSAVNFLPFIPAAVTTWISRGIMVAMFICMFQLVPVNDRYRKAAVYRGVMLACTLITTILFRSTLLMLTLLMLVSMVYSILAVYQEYSAHAELVAEKDPKLSRSWRSLFKWGILAAVLLSFGSTVTAIVLAILEQEMGAARISGIVNGLLRVPQLMIDVVYLLYLRKMLDIFRRER